MAHFHSNPDPPSRLHPFHIPYNQDLLSGPSSHYPPAHPKLNLSPRSPTHHQATSWPPVQDHRPNLSRPWTKPTALNPEVFLPTSGVDSQSYHNFLLMEPMGTNANFSSDAEPYDPSSLPTLANSMLAVDTRADHPQEPAVYFSGSESDSGHELDDEHNTTRDAGKGQPTSIPATSPQAKSLDAVPCRSASFMAIEVPTLHSLMIPLRLTIPL